MLHLFTPQNMLQFTLLGAAIVAPATLLDGSAPPTPDSLMVAAPPRSAFSASAPQNDAPHELPADWSENQAPTLQNYPPLHEPVLPPRLQVPPDENGRRFARMMQNAIARNLFDRSLGEIIQAIAEQFLGTPYIAGLLDKSNQEQLTISLQGFDCVLFVETVLAIARGIAQEDYSYPGFRDRLLEQRYRHGQLNGYCSRLHYFSDWINDNQTRNIVENITPKLGGFPLHKQFNFMTANWHSYPQIAASNANYQCLKNVEANLNQLQLKYIPQHQIYTLYPHLQPGDIIATATDIPGLDVTHTGFVYRYPDGKIGFIHASPSGEVKISPDLQSYVEAVDGQIGIILARPLDPR
ncbi:N-acetylmuramoyl-L-alanine amidase-like domain-containing protein [Phormidium sp. CCY1219]|uniref:N-acetylmuramoyl-L-alanine amidase-like domain-containing protein n=1 Tax=Phormidium sp. CCY1219 TaxID=2886104 RepID=UPI002D1E66EB|nr:N-acetylmuramoyl-L-alanine amidase-like domain-containing protein [Phormidium sp. CCY1219]MEB3831006.1 DUF1460 domain-containing protein [Phormidium sp. CCY1219]